MSSYSRLVTPTDTDGLQYNQYKQKFLVCEDAYTPPSTPPQSYITTQRPMTRDASTSTTESVSTADAATSTGETIIESIETVDVSDMIDATPIEDIPSLDLTLPPVLVTFSGEGKSSLTKEQIARLRGFWTWSEKYGNFIHDTGTRIIQYPSHLD